MSGRNAPPKGSLEWRIRRYEAEGMTRSDAQAVAEAEIARSVKEAIDLEERMDGELAGLEDGFGNRTGG